MASCTLEEGKIEPRGEATDVISASMENPSGDDDTKLELKNSTTLVWEKGDKISVVGTSSATFTLSSGEDTQQGTFVGSFSDAGEAPYFAVMPKDADAVVSNNAVSFSIPQQKAATTGNITSSANPIAGKVGGNGTIAFKNLFGLLKLQVKLKEGASNIDIKKITLHDLGGNMLWGTCTVPILADTLAYDKVTMSGGDNSISMVWNSNTTFKASETKSIYFPVPPGALDNGFSVVFYEKDAATGGIGRAWTFIQKVSNPITAQRSYIITMDPTELYEKSEPLDVKARGYYKTLFVDGGRGLNHFVLKDTLPWIQACGLENDYEYVSCGTGNRDTISNLGILLEAPANNTYDDVTWNDQNGVLLYPDGEPRFRAVFVNGGSSKTHGRYLTQTGRDHFHDFYYNGGSYIAVCAGTFLASTKVDGTNSYSHSTENKNFTFGIFPGDLWHTSMPRNIDDWGSVYTAFQATNSFQTFSKNDTVELVRHHGGSYLPNTQENIDLNPQPEKFLSYQYTEDPKAETDSTLYTDYNRQNYQIWGAGKVESRVGKIAVWAYKNSASTGRAVLCGSHPECNTSTRQIRLMKDMVEYALAESGDPVAKESLELGTTRNMTADWSDNTPNYAKIGDRQYHHFTLNVPTELEEFILTLDSNYDASSGVDLYLAMRKGNFAWLSDADYVLCNKGGQKTIRIKTLPAGTWYVSVYCPTTVTATAADGYNKELTHFFKYSGKTETQDGIAYTLTPTAVGHTASSLPDYSGSQISLNTTKLDD